MDSKSFPHHAIEPCSSMIELLNKIEYWYSDNIAFINGNATVPYSELCDSVRRCISFFVRSEYQYYYLNISNAYCFAVAYLATVCSGKIAVLSKYPIYTDPSGNTPVKEVTEELIKSAITSECPCKTIDNLDPTSPATIAQSSGTTSVSKGVVLSQKALLCNMHAGMSAIKFDATYRYLHVIPYYHLFGLVSNMLAPLYAGATICDSGAPLNFYSDFKSYHITSTCLPPILVTGLWKVIQQYGFQDVTGGYLKKIICAGAPPDYSVYDGFEAKGVHVYTGYGLTECSPCVSVNGEFANKTGSCGPPVICNRVKIIDGEIAVKGDNLMLGYWEAPFETSKVMIDGWLMTGDLGYIDEDGFLFVTGRKTNLIVFENGEKVMPEQLEAKIASISGVKECKVNSHIEENKVLLDCTIVSMEEKNTLEAQVKQLLSNSQLLNRLHKITITDRPFDKTVLGKIKR